MKQTIRFKTFETNSSSYHSCCILTDEEYKEIFNFALHFVYLSMLGQTEC